MEDLLRLVRVLPPDASAVAAVREGLCGLDSGALAALLKELAKGGLGKRAIEIFDWLRSLDERSDFGSLCDVYTCVICTCDVYTCVEDFFPQNVDPLASTNA